MPVWPFGRGRKASSSKVKDDTGPTRVAERKPPVAARANDTSNSGPPRRQPSRRNSRRKRTSSRSTTSMHDDEKSSPAADRPANPFLEKQRTLTQSSSEDITALPWSKRLEQSPHLRPITQDHAIPYNFHSNSHSSLPSARERGKLQRPQSLRKRPANESSVARRKSSKKRKNDNVREEEIRAMSMPLPQKRPAGSSGGMLRRDSKKMKGGLHRSSNISLPAEDSIHSSMSGNSETRAYRVSALDMFSPRPKIRYSVGSQYYYSGAGPSPTSQDRNDSRKDRRTTFEKEKEREKLDKEEKRSRRIDDLADTLDAGALREILERDKRRKEKKRKSEEERLRRRLERRAEKQKASEHTGTPATPRREARGLVGLGIEKETATPMEDVRPSTPPHIQRQSWEHIRPSTPQSQRIPPVPQTPKAEEVSQLPTPLESPMEEPVVANARAIRYSRASMPSPTPAAHARGPSNISQMPDLLSEIAAREKPIQSIEPPEPVVAQDPNASGSLHPVETSDTTATATSPKGAARRSSSERRRMGVFASLFRRGKRRSQDQGTRTTPSEISFSNTSRESMSRQPPPAHLVGPTQPVEFRRASVPRRTMSKFREDLPEFPMSPPDSRVQSPEVTTSGIARHQSQPTHAAESSSSGPGRTDSPVSPGVPPTGLMSQSLASVDSEGSWLSGKPLKRQSNKSQMRSSVSSSTQPKRNEEFNASYEELGIPDDEYFRRLTPQPDEHRKSAQSGDLMARKPSSTAMAVTDAAADSEDEEHTTTGRRSTESENLVQHTVGRQPTIIHRQGRVKSTEALLGFFQNDKTSLNESHRISAESGEQDSPDSPTSDVEPTLQRAQSIDLGKHHVRHLSAGSAKLLDIPSKRSSTPSRFQLPE